MFRKCSHLSTQVEQSLHRQGVYRCDRETRAILIAKMNSSLGETWLPYIKTKVQFSSQPLNHTPLFVSLPIQALRVAPRAPSQPDETIAQSGTRKFHTEMFRSRGLLDRCGFFADRRQATGCICNQSPVQVRLANSRGKFTLSR